MVSFSFVLLLLAVVIYYYDYYPTTTTSSSSCIAVNALVNIPERRPVKTWIQQRQQQQQPPRLTWEFSPLLGGPSWLPIHVKVLLQDNNIVHRWDYVPINATEPTTLIQLLSLQSVPAQIRYQPRRRSRVVQKQQQQSPPHDPTKDVITGYDIVINEMIPYCDFNDGDDNDRISEKQQQQNPDVMNTANDDDTLLLELVQQAQMFCATYPNQLHLIHNNCWTFAFELYQHLLSTKQLLPPTVTTDSHDERDDQ